MISVVALTHTGLHRQTNQDRIVVGSWVLSSGRREPASSSIAGRPFVCAVIDGMGGHAGGSIAATIAADRIAASHDLIYDEPSLELTIDQANDAVYAAMAEAPCLAGMGATVALVCVLGEELLIANVGDARVYLDLGGELVVATVDDASPTQPGAITQSLGGMSRPEPVRAHVFREVAAGRRLLLASDGLFGHVEHHQLEQAMEGHDGEEAALRLLDVALDGGAPDNVSLVLVSIDEEPHG